MMDARVQQVAVAEQFRHIYFSLLLAYCCCTLVVLCMNVTGRVDNQLHSCTTVDFSMAVEDYGDEPLCCVRQR